MLAGAIEMDLTGPFETRYIRLLPVSRAALIKALPDAAAVVQHFKGDDFVAHFALADMAAIRAV